eukprot:15004117-Ditylum_brightwellii.AAC.1
MEAHTALELVKHAKRHRGFIVGCVIANDDSSMKALLRHFTQSWRQMIPITSGQNFTLKSLALLVKKLRDS